MFLPAPLFSSLIVPSNAFYYGEYGSVCFRWQSACLALCLNSLITCSLLHPIPVYLGPPVVQAGVTMSHVHHFFVIGYALQHICSPV